MSSGSWKTVIIYLVKLLTTFIIRILWGSLFGHGNGHINQSKGKHYFNIVSTIKCYKFIWFDAVTGHYRKQDNTRSCRIHSTRLQNTKVQPATPNLHLTTIIKVMATQSARRLLTNTVENLTVRFFPGISFSHLSENSYGEFSFFFLILMIIFK